MNMAHERHSFSRRQLLSGLAVSAATLAGCGTPRGAQGTALTRSTSSSATTGGAKKHVLTFNSQGLSVLFGSYFGTIFPRLRAAWETDNPNVRLGFAQPPDVPDIMGAFGDMINGNLNLVPLRPVLQPLGFDWSAVPPRVLGTFADQNGVPLALPLSLGEVQFYANHAALRQLGADKSAWSFQDMKTVLEVQRLALGDATQAPLILGLDPSTPNVWATFVLGLGGKFDFSSDSLDVRSLTAATEALVSFAQRYNWGASAAATSENRNFFTDGFAGVGGSALFAFMPPWTGIGAQSTPPSDLVPLPFPGFPYANNIPAATASGMGIRVESRQQELAGRFLAWLYQPQQQTLLMSLGLPPCVTTSSVQAAWETYQAQNVGKGYPRFTLSGYLDVQTLLPNPAVSFPRNALGDMFHTGDVHSGLQQLQQQYEQSVAAVGRTSLPAGY